MAADDLTTPLGLGPRPRPFRRATPFAVIAGVLGIAAAAGLVFVARSGDWQIPGPGVVAAIKAPATAPAAIDPADRTGSIAKLAAPAGAASAPAALTEIDPDGDIAELGGDVVIHDPSDPPVIRLAAAPREDLVEKSRYGLLPRIGDDGTRPLEAYARPADAASGTARIAIVVGGIGIAGDTTDQALARLPGAVTLAFAPYGSNLPQALARARAGGHEILLQIPLEPFD
jgi:hypothetical protein